MLKLARRRTVDKDDREEQQLRLRTMSKQDRPKKHGNVGEDVDKKAIPFETSVQLEARAPGHDEAFDCRELAETELLVGGGDGYSLEMKSLTRSGSEHEDRARSGLERTNVNVDVDVEVGETPRTSLGRSGEDPRSDGEVLSVDAIVREIARLQDMLRLHMDGKRPSPTELLDGEIEDSDDVGIGSTAEAANADSWERSPALVRSERRQMTSKPGAVRVFPGDTRASNEDDSVSLDPQPPAPSGTARQAATTTSEDAILLEADLVADQDEQSEASVSVALLVEAKIIRRRRQVLTIAGLIFLSCLIVAIAVGVPLYNAQKRAQSGGSASLLEVSVASRQDEFNERLANSTLEAIQNGTSAQAKAYEWLFGAGDHPDLPQHEAIKRMFHRFSLATLYYSTGGNTTWKAGAGWLEKNLHECSWHGVRCATITADSVSTCKDEQGFVSEIPTGILNVSELKSIDLSSNGLTGSLPEEMGLLSGAFMLQSIALQSNDIGGMIPPSLGELTRLQFLRLYQNAFEGRIPPALSSLRRLETLQLFQNKLTEAIPSEIAGLSNLREFEASQNKLMGSIPSEIASLTNLLVLDLSGNELMGVIPPEIANLTSLQRFAANQNNLTGSIPPALYELTNLGLLDLDGNLLTGTVSKNVEKLSMLTELNIWNNKGLTGSLPTELGRLTGLTQLYILSSKFSGPRLSGPIPNELGNLSQLTNLILSGYTFSGPIPSELSRLTLLDWLYLQRNELSGSIPSELGLLTKLGELDVSSNTALAGPVPESLCELIDTNNLVELRRLQLLRFVQLHLRVNTEEAVPEVCIPLSDLLRCTWRFSWIVL